MERRLLVSLLCFVSAGCTGVIAGENSDQSGTGSNQSAGGSSGPGGGGPVDPSDPGVAELPGGLTLEGKPVYYRVVRLTHEQWENSVRDVLLLTELPGQSSGFVPDPPDGKFSNNERALYVSDSLRTDYQRAAEEVAAAVAQDSAALARLGSAEGVGAFISSLGRRAYRRALTTAEETKLTAMYTAGAGFFASGNGFADGAQLVIESILQSPHFLYRIELGADGQRLSGYELASKLSFLLRNTTPSEALLAAADAGTLDSAEGVAASAQEMLAEPSAKSVLERFHNELFGLYRYGSILKSPSLFPTYSEAINSTLLQADLAFFGRVFDSGAGLREILTSKVAFVNQETAGFYGLTATGSGLTQVTLGAGRPGFLTRLGFLAYNATLRDPDPIHRGVDINNRLLCAKLEPPAGEIPPLPEYVPGQTNRERVTAHTGSGTCAGCHSQVINPLGFALEGFDAMGQARTTDNDKSVDTSGEYLFTDGLKSFSGIEELVGLLSDSQQAHGCYAANLAEFTLARDVAGGEGELVSELQRKSIEEDASLKDILLTMVQDPLFVTAKGGAQ